ncbi:serine/threonine protein kinase [Massospora cicadina]|nr:serine/threonine protein kinase [Massospora cicadina]
MELAGLPSATLNGLRPTCLSKASFGQDNPSTPTSSITSLPSSDSDGTICSVPTRFVLDSNRFSAAFNPTLRSPRLYRPAKYCRRHNKELSALPHQLQILYERGTTPSPKLGDGAMGSVYLVRRKADGRVFAAKVHAKDHPKMTRAQYLKRIADEVIIASAMHHPHIIRPLDFVSSGGKFLTIMEYCPTDLFDAISSKSLPPNQIDTYFVQLLLGVRHLHAAGIAHRDLKLENMCIGSDGRLKIIDFGCATSFRAPFTAHPTPVRGIYGSDPYIAPEIWGRLLYDAVKADIWSLGVVYVAMQSGRFLWDKAKLQDARYARFLDNVGSTLKSKVPAHALPLLTRLLDPNPNTRATLEECFEEAWIVNLLNASPLIG